MQHSNTQQTVRLEQRLTTASTAEFVGNCDNPGDDDGDDLLDDAIGGAGETGLGVGGAGGENLNRSKKGSDKCKKKKDNAEGIEYRDYIKIPDGARL